MAALSERAFLTLPSSSSLLEARLSEMRDSRLGGAVPEVDDRVRLTGAGLIGGVIVPSGATSWAIWSQMRCRGQALADQPPGCGRSEGRRNQLNGRTSSEWATFIPSTTSDSLMAAIRDWPPPLRL